MADPGSSRIFLVEDHPIVRDGFRELLESEESYAVVGEAGSGEEAVEKLAETEADPAVVDISMEGMDGIELTRHLTENHLTGDGVGREGSRGGEPNLSGPQVLIISMHNETRYVEAALEASAGGYVLKDNVHRLLLEATRRVLGGGLYVCPELEEMLNR